MTAPICPTVCGGGTGGVGGVYSATKIRSADFVVPPGAVTEVDFLFVDIDEGPAITPDLAGNSLVIEQDGFYEVIVTELWASDPNAVEFSLALRRNGVPILRSRISEPLISKASTISGLFELEAGDELDVTVSFTGATDSVRVEVSLSAEKRD